MPAIIRTMLHSRLGRLYRQQQGTALHALSLSTASIPYTCVLCLMCRPPAWIADEHLIRFDANDEMTALRCIVLTCLSYFDAGCLRSGRGPRPLQCSPPKGCRYSTLAYAYAHVAHVVGMFSTQVAGIADEHLIHFDADDGVAGCLPHYVALDPSMSCSAFSFCRFACFSSPVLRLSWELVCTRKALLLELSPLPQAQSP